MIRNHLNNVVNDGDQNQKVEFMLVLHGIHSLSSDKNSRTYFFPQNFVMNLGDFGMERKNQDFSIKYQETRSKRQEARDKKQETRGKRQEARDKKQDFK
jgi:hypothetical protein